MRKPGKKTRVEEFVEWCQNNQFVSACICHVESADKGTSATGGLRHTLKPRIERENGKNLLV